MRAERRETTEPSWRRVQLCLGLSGFAVGVFELTLTRLSNVFWGRWLTWIILSGCLAGISLGAVVAHRLLGSGRPARQLRSWSDLLPVVLAASYWACLNSDAAWTLACFVAPFVCFGGLTTCGWLWAHDLGSSSMRTRQYTVELAGTFIGLAVAGPLLASSGGTLWLAVAAVVAAVAAAQAVRTRLSAGRLLLWVVSVASLYWAPDPMQAHVGPGNQLQRIEARHHVIRRQARFSPWARTDVLESQERAWLFTDGHFVARTAPYAPSAKRFASKRLETLASPKRLAWTTLKTGARALIVGAGGGFDVAIALQHGATEVTALEINGDLLDMVQQRPKLTGDIYRHPGVRVVQAEARRWIDGSPERWDQIQLALVETGTALSRGHSTAHGRLLTTEGVRSWMRHLLPRGVLCVVQNTARLHQQTIAQVASALGDPQGRRWLSARWVAGDLSTQPFAYVVLVRDAPWTPEERRQLATKASTLGLKLDGAVDASATKVATDDSPTVFTRRWSGVELFVALWGLVFALSLLRRRGGAQPARAVFTGLCLGIAGIWTQARWTEVAMASLGAPDWALGVTVGGVLAAAAVGANIAAIRSRPWLAPLSVAALNLCAPALITEATPLPLPAAIALCALILALAGLPLAGPWLTLLEQAGTRSATTAVISAESLGAMIAGITVPGLISAIGLSGLGWAATLCWCFAVASATWQGETTPTRAP